MSVAAYLSELRERGVEVVLSDGRLTCRASRGAITPEITEALRSRKADIVAFLREGLAEQAGSMPIPRLRPQPRQELMPLSYTQERLWFLNQVETNPAVFNVPLCLHIRGPLDVDILQHGLDALEGRHEAMRTTLVEREGVGFQRVHPGRGLPIRLVDLARDEAAGRTVEEVLTEEASAPFDLAAAPAVRALLLRVCAEEHYLLVVMHHTLTDGASVGIVLQELVALYEAFKAGKPSPLPPPVLQFVDYAAWQRGWLQGEVLEDQLLFWKEQLGGELPVLDIPTDFPRPPVRGSNGSKEPLRLPQSVVEGLTRIGQEEGATTFMSMLAVFLTLLHRHSGQDDLLVGIPVANRTRQETQPIVGYLANTLVLRTSLAGSPTFRELIRRVREGCIGAFRHQDMPFQKIVEALQPPRDLSRTPIFQVFFTYDEEFIQPSRMGDLSLERVIVGSTVARQDMTIFLRHVGAEVHGSLEYNTDLFSRESIVRMLEHFGRLARSAAANPDARVADLQVLTPEECRMLAAWNATDRAYPRDRCVHELFSEQAARTPEAVAIERGGERLTYAELEARSNQLAHYLREVGVSEGSLCAVCTGRSLEMIVALLGILKAGAAYVPLAPEYPRERLEFMLGDSRAPVLLTQAALLPQLPEHPKVFCLDRDLPGISHLPVTPPAVGTTPDDLVYVMYTSGSTGTPKGVMVPHRGVTRLVFGVEYARLDESRVFLQLAPISFDAATFEIWGPLLHGGRCVLYPEDRLDPATLERVLRDAGVTTLWLTSSLFNMVIDERPQALESVEELLIGGEALSVPHVRKGLDLLRRTRITNGYGPTESTTFATCHAIHGPLDESVTAIPIGRPIGNTRVYILDRRLEPVPPGVAGEIYIGGDGLARGYHQSPALTAEKFAPDPFSQVPGARMYRTGDLARYLSDGNIDFLGRTDEQVKIRGFRIEIGEIEAVLSSEPTVRSAAVMLHQKGAEKQLVAHVVAAAGADPSAARLRMHLASKLPEYMVPAEIVWHEALPLGPSGKVDRLALARAERPRSQVGEAFVEPRTPTELILAEMMAQLLGVERVGSTDSFFDLGGHSLLAARLVSRIQAAFGVQISIATIFMQPTVARLAPIILGQSPGGIGLGMFQLRPGSKRSAVFIVPNVVGLFVYAQRLATYIHSGHGIYCLTLPERGGAPFTFQSIEELAGYFADRILSSHPDGPYHLVGHSFGGTVAFEIGRQLEARQREVGVLAILDTRPVSKVRVTLPEIARSVRSVMQDGLYTLRHDFKRGTLGTSLRRMARRIRLKVSRADRSDWVDDFIQEWNLAALPHAYAEVTRANLDAMTRYEEKPFGGRLTLIRAQRLNVVREFRRDLGWGFLANGGVDVRIVAGDHMSLVEGDGAIEVGRHLTDALASAP